MNRTAIESQAKLNKGADKSGNPMDTIYYR